jgi:hypothetical protein
MFFFVRRLEQPLLHFAESDEFSSVFRLVKNLAKGCLESCTYSSIMLFRDKSSQANAAHCTTPYGRTSDDSHSLPRGAVPSGEKFRSEEHLLQHSAQTFRSEIKGRYAKVAMQGR